ncbi:MAG: hypothetical protein U0T73_13010 [Chitinophagales bacterium]
MAAPQVLPFSMKRNLLCLFLLVMAGSKAQPMATSAQWNSVIRHTEMYCDSSRIAVKEHGQLPQLQLINHTKLRSKLMKQPLSLVFVWHSWCNQAITQLELLRRLLVVKNCSFFWISDDLNNKKQRKIAAAVLRHCGIDNNTYIISDKTDNGDFMNSKTSLQFRKGMAMDSASLAVFRYEKVVKTYKIPENATDVEVLRQYLESLSTTP